MAHPVRLALKNILWIPDIYPRHEVNEERVSWFVDLMSTGKHFPAIKVTEYDGEPLIFDVDEDTMRDLKSGKKYVLLDGKHRVEAYKRLGKEWIEAYFFNTPSASWDFASAGFNAEGPLNLVPGEWKKLIIRGYHRRIKAGKPASPKDIAEEIGGAVTIDYVRKVLKPFRDPEKKKLHEKIVNLRKKGFTQQKIADEVGLSQPTVAQILAKTGNSINSKERLERNRQIFALRDQGLTQEQIAKKVGISQQAVAKILAKNTTVITNKTSLVCNSSCNDNNIKNIEEHKQTDADGALEQSPKGAASAASSGTIHGSQSPAQAENIPEEAPDITESLDVPETKHNTQPAKVLQFPVKESYRNILLGDYSDEEKEEKLLKLLEEEEKQASKYDPRNEEDNAALDIYKMCISTMSNKKGYKAMRALELLKQLKWDLVQISEFLGEPLDFIRRVCIAAIGLQVAPGSAKETAKEKARSMLELSHDIVTAISNAIWAEYMMGPVGEGIPEWMEENLSESDLELVAKIASSPKATYIGEDIKYLVLGKVPARQRAKYYTELPPEEKEKIEHDMHEITVCFRKYRDLLNTGMYRGEALMCVVKTYNRTKVASNQLDEAILSCRKRGYL